MDITEKSFEQAIEDALVAAPGQYHGNGQKAIGDSPMPYGDSGPGGYLKRKPEDYHRGLCLDPDLVVGFLQATQPKEWAKLAKQHGAEVRERFLKRLASEVSTRGTLELLRKGVKDSGCKFRMAYFKPLSGLNQELQKLYQANLFSVVRQLKYSEKNENSLDLALFLNGLPIFTAELKNPLTGQNVEDAVRQYCLDRDPRESLFAFGRCLAHFAVDPDLIYMTTQLQGSATRFLPFNQGNGTGAGNPSSWQGFATAYLWERIWSRDSVLNLMQQFIQSVEEEDDRGHKTGEKRIIFPRYHQLDAVRRLVADARAKGPGQHYLIEHSAGSGKSNSIAWLAHQLAGLHGDDDRRVFESVVVVTDRRILDRQLQRTVRQFQQVEGVVENIDKTSRQLKAALEDGKNVIVTTLQKFPVIVKEIQELPGHRFAVIIDEAHSSQSGESSKSLNQVLGAGSLEEAEREESVEEEDLEDRIVAEMKKRGRQPNVSYFAFTATPKPKTLELFGTRQPDGSFQPFSLYTMRQAIEERFILDVLENYTTYKSYFSLLKKIEEDPRYDRQKAVQLLRSFVDLHEHSIQKKVEIMVDHFVERSMGRIGGRAKGMIVTRSRLHAVKYRQAVDHYLKEKGYPFRALVAFSGTVRADGLDYTEAGMNGLPEKQTAEAFKRDEYRFLIVANKFQTGFDQPLLHTMYVDKRLGGVNAVQTLSRLNRTHPGKEETMVLDFANEPEEIQKSFEPYYEKTLLREGTDPNLLYDLETRLADFHFFSQPEVDQFAALYFAPNTKQDRLHAALAPAIQCYSEALEEDRVAFRSRLTDYVRLYAFLSQVISFVDADLEKLYLFGRLLLRKLPVPRDRLPVEIQQKIDMESYRIQKVSGGKIGLQRGQGVLEPIGLQGQVTSTPDDLELLSQILRELNRRFGTEFTGEDRVFIQQLEARLEQDPALEASVRVNTRDNARLTFDHVVNDRLQEMVDTNFRFYKQVTDDAEFSKFFLQWLFERYYRRKRAGGTEPSRGLVAQ